MNYQLAWAFIIILHKHKYLWQSFHGLIQFCAAIHCANRQHRIHYEYVAKKSPAVNNCTIRIGNRITHELIIYYRKDSVSYM